MTKVMVRRIRFVWPTAEYDIASPTGRPVVLAFLESRHNSIDKLPNLCYSRQAFRHLDDCPAPVA
jgi:hypothetical protein